MCALLTNRFVRFISPSPHRQLLKSSAVWRVRPYRTYSRAKKNDLAFDSASNKRPQLSSRFRQPKLRDGCKGKAYHEMTAKPMNAARILNTSATIPFAVNPSGNLAGGCVAPSRFMRSSVLPAALPAVAIFWDLQTCRWSSGILRFACMSSGASTKVAVRPLATCHSMWQWKSQMRERIKCQLRTTLDVGTWKKQGGHISGLSARKRRTMWPFGRTMTVSRLIGTSGNVPLLA